MFFASWVLVFACRALGAHTPSERHQSSDLGNSSGDVSSVVKRQRNTEHAPRNISGSPNWLQSPPTLSSRNPTVGRITDEKLAADREREHVQRHGAANVTSTVPKNIIPVAVHHQAENSSLQDNRSDVTTLLPDLKLPLPPIQSSNATEWTSSPATLYLHSLISWLRASHHQGIIVAGAVVIGAFCAWDGPGVWRVLFTVLGAMAASALVHFEVHGTDLVYNQGAEAVILLQVAGSAALSIHCGFEGSQVMLGAILGFMGAYGCGDWVRSLDGILPHGPGFSVFLYLVGTVLGILLCTLWRKPVLAMLGPLLGGLLLASSAGTIISRSYAALPEDGDCRMTGCLLPLPPADTPWVDVAKALLGPLQRSALAAHCSCAVAAMFIHRFGKGRSVFAIVCLVFYILLSALAAVDCPRKKAGEECLSSVAVQWWEWRVAGCLLWALITSGSAWRQLRMLNSVENGGYGGFVVHSPSFETHDVAPPPGGFLPLHQRDGEAAYFASQDGPPSLSQWLTARRSNGDFTQKLDA